ncbi:hypothetical protein V6Z11_D07G118700 [Gossypium hirsutum]
MASNSERGYPTNGSVYVCNLPEGTDESMLAEYFGTIGLLKNDKRTGRPKVWLYRDKVTNEPKESMGSNAGVDVGFEDDAAKEMDGGGGRGRGRLDSSGKMWQQEGDWLCPNTSCSNVNFSFRGVCN